MIAWESFKNKPVYLTVGVVALILLGDFFSRVWYPLDTQLTADRQQGNQAEFNRFQFETLPRFLDDWISQVEREAAEQQQATDEETEEEAARRREAELERKLQPLDGATELESIRLRVRAIFKHQNEDGQAQSLALAEQQDIATGDVSRVILRPGEERGGYVIADISAHTVELTHPTEQGIRLYVFEFK